MQDAGLKFFKLTILLLVLCPASFGVESVKKTPESIQIWDTLTSIDQNTKAASKIKKLLSKPVEVAGFTIVNEFNAGEISEFMLTRFASGCIHVPSPPPNNMIHVVMIKGKTTPSYFGYRVLVHGTLKTGDRVDAAYEMIADSVKKFPYSK